MADQLIGRRHATARGRGGESCATGLMSVRSIGSSLEGDKATHGGETVIPSMKGVGVVIAVLPSRRTLVAVVATVLYNRMALQGLGAKHVHIHLHFIFYFNVFLISFPLFMFIFILTHLLYTHTPHIFTRARAHILRLKIYIILKKSLTKNYLIYTNFS